MPTPKEKRPIIVIKKKGGHAGHHGGAWKVAYADFVTAMMSLFIVLWLMSSSDQVKKAIAGYFNDPRGSGKEVGSAAAGAGEALTIDQQNVTKLKDEIKKAIARQDDLMKLSKQIDITVTGEGLRIDLLEGSGGTFFQSGSPKLSESGVKLISLLAGQLKSLPNHVLLEGHTDSQPFSSTNGYTNWELSSDRANSARRLLQQAGIGPTQVAQVRGYADQHLRVPSNPADPSNRRVSLIVQWMDASDAADNKESSVSTEGNEVSTSQAKPGHESAVAKPAEAKAADAPTAKPSEAEAADTKSIEAKPGESKSTEAPPAAPATKPGLLSRVTSFFPGKKR